ncbi:MAG: phosphoethanolamine transferase CptA [Gammaproteobacteria bacterium]|nr:MAG: phosphoethanolamine transferase CptA [Gammaproteobacteria bacterium]
MQRFAIKHPILWAYLFIAFFSLSYQLPIYATGMSGFAGLREVILFSMAWLIPIFLIPQHSRKWLALAGIIMWPAALVSLFYFIIYGQEFSQSAIFIAFESNVAEGSEFIQSYWKWWFTLPLAAFAVIPVWMWRNTRPLEMPVRKRYTYALVFSLITFWPFIGTAVFEPDKSIANAAEHQFTRIEPTAPWNLVIGYHKYLQQMDDMTELLNKNRQIEPLQHLVASKDSLPDTVVLVIGESTNRQRMSLYGYQRPTTPRLDALRDNGELLVYNDVVSPRPYTIEALQQILSFADSKNPERFFTEPTLINMMKQAGYEITWITNQQTQTRRNTMLTTFSQMADHQIYLNNNREQNASQYDGAVLEPFTEALNNPASKQLIVVHLLGTHRAYHYRYPPEFAQFNDHEGAPAWITPDLTEEYNSYDNAILYNDMVVSALIDDTRAKGDDSLLIYFSDHGEEVYDNPNELFTGRNEGDPSTAMYTVPFMVWTSPAFRQQRDLSDWRNAVERPYSNAYFIYTFADMVGLDFDGMDYSASLVSKQFTSHPRWIGDPSNPGSLKDYSSIERAEGTMTIAQRHPKEEATKAL